MSSDGIRSARTFAIILIVHLAVIVLWQVLVDAFQVPKFILPSPLAAVATLASAKYAWLSNLAVTAVEILGGFCLGALVGVTLAVMFSWSPLISLVLLPLFVTLNMIPKVALGPAVHRLVLLRHFSQHPDRVQHLLLPDPADHRARPAARSSPICSISSNRCAARAGRCSARSSCRARCLTCFPA